MSELEVLSGAEGQLGGPSVLETEDTGPMCEKCESLLPDEAMSACPSCGWYASMGIHVEIATEWEQACSGQPASQQPQSHLEVWSKLIPLWGWALIGTTLAVAAASLGVRVWTAENASLHTTWAVMQLAIGLALLGASHLLAFFMAAAADPDMGVQDLVVSPLRGWLKLIAKLPSRFWVLNSANLGLSAALCAVLIIGGLPYDDIWNWGFKPPAKKNLIGAIADKAGGGQNDMSFEDAMGEFAQNAAVSGQTPGGGQSKDKKKGPIERQKIDAVILGYELSTDGKIDRLLLATEYNGNLLYAGRVRPLLTKEEAEELPGRLQAARAPRPLINVPGSAIWVQPRFTCRVTFNRRVESGMLQGIVWEEMLGEVKLP